MFIAHAFGGYLGTRLCLKSQVGQELSERRWMSFLIFGIICSILPDIDLLYFYTLDHRQHPHHQFWTHMPFFWITVSLFVYALGRWKFRPYAALISLLLLGGTFMHMILDSVAGGIFWLYPLSDTYFKMFTITPRFQWWVLNYIIHWTFLAEVAIVASALWVYRSDERVKSFVQSLLVQKLIPIKLRSRSKGSKQQLVVETD